MLLKIPFRALTDVQTECQMQCLEVTLALEEHWSFEDFLALYTAILGQLMSPLWDTVSSFEM